METVNGLSENFVTGVENRFLQPGLTFGSSVRILVKNWLACLHQMVKWPMLHANWPAGILNHKLSFMSKCEFHLTVWRKISWVENSLVFCGSSDLCN